MNSADICKSCGSCGFPMREPGDFAGGNPAAEYCCACADDSGRLKPYDDVLQVNADYYVRQQGVDPKAAREMARALMASMPAWKSRS